MKERKKPPPNAPYYGNYQYRLKAAGLLCSHSIGLGANVAAEECLHTEEPLLQDAWTRPSLVITEKDLCQQPIVLADLNPPVDGRYPGHLLL